MQRTRSSLLICTVVSVITLVLMSPAVTRAATAPQCGAWKVSPTPSLKSTTNSFMGVAAISSKSVWAVGYHTVLHTLTEHWNGTTWSLVKSPNPGGSQPSQLYSVAGVASKDVWAVGTYYDSNFVSHTLIIHWNGSQWSQVTSPDPGAYENILYGVTAYASNDVWAVGDYRTGIPDKTLIEHWNGTSWSVVKSPNTGKNNNGLYSVSADSATDAWAVGYRNIGLGDTQIIEHWNGSQWSVVPNPAPSTANLLSGVVALSQNSAWTVGYYNNNSNEQTLIEQWNGTSWSIVSSPNEGSGYNQLYSVTQVPGNNTLWAAGFYTDSTGAEQALSEHWNGSQWSVVPTAVQGFYASDFRSISVSDSSHVWAAGSYATGPDTNYPLAEIYC